MLHNKISPWCKLRWSERASVCSRVENRSRVVLFSETYSSLATRRMYNTLVNCTTSTLTQHKRQIESYRNRWSEGSGLSFKKLFVSNQLPVTTPRPSFLIFFVIALVFDATQENEVIFVFVKWRLCQEKWEAKQTKIDRISVYIHRCFPPKRLSLLE